MRECLGWLTNCPDDRRCPQNWLELSYTELPATVQCQVCGQEIRAVPTEAEFDQAIAEPALAAFPVVPCTGAPAAYGKYWDQGSPPAPMDGEGPEDADAAPSAPPPRSLPAADNRVMFCILGNGDAIKVEKETAVIGRSRTCDIIIPSAKVSRQHASVKREGGEYYIEDLGSANGVWRDGEKLAGRTKINHGDVFTISEESLTFELR